MLYCYSEIKRWAIVNRCSGTELAGETTFNEALVRKAEDTTALQRLGQLLLYCKSDRSLNLHIMSWNCYWFLSLTLTKTEHGINHCGKFRRRVHLKSNLKIRHNHASVGNSKKGDQLEINRQHSEKVPPLDIKKLRTAVRENRNVKLTYLYKRLNVSNEQAKLKQIGKNINVVNNML